MYLFSHKYIKKEMYLTVDVTNDIKFSIKNKA
jgi:hypothetical protein